MRRQNPDRSVEESQTNAAARRAKGEFMRGVSQFRSALGSTAFPAEAHRYHLYVALNCPWSHRVTLARSLLRLQHSITLDVAFPNRTDEADPEGPNHWQFAPERIASISQATLPDCTQETATGQNFRLLKNIYAKEGSQERSVPVLYDKHSQSIVSNESAEIVRMMGQNAAALGSGLADAERIDLYPADQGLRSQIDALNGRIYDAVNNGAYKAGFSSDQSVYEAAFHKYFNMLEELNALLQDGRAYLTGEAFTEADLKLFPTLYRHDPVYYLRMKLNGAKIFHYPDLWRWLCRVYALPGVAESGPLTHCLQGYFGRSWNGVIPLGPRQPRPYPEAYHHPELAKSAKSK